MKSSLLDASNILVLAATPCGDVRLFSTETLLETDRLKPLIVMLAYITWTFLRI